MNLLTLIAIGKILACAAAIGLLIILRIARQHRLPDVDRRAGIALGVLMILSVAFFLDFGYYPKHGRFMNPHGWYHYYLGAKYSAELGYDDLYNATVVASTENNGRLMHDRVRSMRTYAMVPSDIMRDAEGYRALFTPERWDAFKKDVAYFQEITIPRRWPGVVHDKGYNATPVWNMFGAWITNATDTAKPFHMRLLLWLDPLLLALMLGAVRSAFGARAMLFVLVYFGAHFAFGMYGVNETGALLRWDWLACLGIAICLLRLGHYKSAGALVAVAGMSRLFPLVFLSGWARFAWDIYTNRRIARHYVEFFWAFAAVAVALVTASVVWDGGLQHWRDFLERSRCTTRAFPRSARGLNTLSSTPSTALRGRKRGLGSTRSRGAPARLWACCLPSSVSGSWRITRPWRFPMWRCLSSARPRRTTRSRCCCRCFCFCRVSTTPCA